MPDLAALANRNGTAFWTMAFRPFFLAASLWSAFALGLWIGVISFSLQLPSRFSPVDWHVHEMLFGFIAAAIAGFILTAIPNWTKRTPIQGLQLAGLFLLWLIGRVACLTSAWTPAWFSITLDCSFLLALAVVAARELLLAGNRRNLIMPVPIAVMLTANILMHFETLGFGVPAGMGQRLGIAAVIVLIAVIGGRIIPTFTRNWLMARHLEKLPAAAGLLDVLAIATLAMGLLSWAFLPASRFAGAMLLAAAGLNAGRLSRWRGLAATGEPLLVILHVGYLWLAIGIGLLGASVITGVVPEAAAIHALTAGAMGTMVLAVMSRVSLGHTGRNLRADAITNVIYGTVTAAALARLMAALLPTYYHSLIAVSGVVWIGSFLIFAGHYGPMLIAPRINKP